MNSKAEILQRPFVADQIRRRPGRNGDDVVYVEAHVIIGRLNEAFDGDWSFRVESHQILEDEVVVLGMLTAGSITKSAFGSSAITRPRDGGKPVSIGDDLKSGATDALKKAATLLGIGLNLQAACAGGEPAASAPSRTTTNANRLLSAAQLRAIHAIRRKTGWSDAQFADFAVRVTGSADVERMDKRAASAFIDRLQAEAAPAGASR